MKVENCRSCGAPIIWARNPKTKKWMPLNEAVTEKENPRFVIVGDSQTALEAFLTKVGRGHTSHFATCPQRDGWRKENKKQGTLFEEGEEE